MPTYYAPGKRKGNKAYIVRGWAGGRQREIRTSTRDKKVAERVWRDLKKRADRERDELHPRTPQTFRDAALRYLAFRKPDGQEPQYIDKLCAVIGSLDLASIQQHDLIEAANALYAGRAPATINRQALVPAAAILHYAAENGWRTWIRVKKLKEKRPETRAISQDTARVILANTEGELLLLLTYLFRQGTRISDVLRITWGDIDLKAGTVRHYVSKTDEWREVPLHLDVIELLRAEKNKLGRVFPWRTRHGVYKELRPVLKRLGIKFTPHQARHSFATWLVNEGVSLPELMEAGGWRDPKSVMRYGKVDQARVREVIHRAGNRGLHRGK